MSEERRGGERRVLLTGATGYIGGRLMTALQERGVPLRCAARSPERLTHRACPNTEVVAGDLLEPDQVDAAMEGITEAYYLVHSMGGSGSFVERDRQAARNFAEAASRHGVERIIYVGGLGDDDDPELSKHLSSRHEVGDTLRASGVPVIEFRASIVIGSGSLSFEIMRALVERLPIMTTPRWVSTLCQPIAIEDLVEYLVAALDVPLGGSQVYEIGGADQLSYADLMLIYAEIRGLKRYLIKVPVLTPGLSSLWLTLVTPAYYRVGRSLIESLTTPTVVTDDSAARDFDIQPRGVRAAIDRALHNEDKAFAETSWSDALATAEGARSWGGVRFGNRLVDSRRAVVGCSPEEAFAPIQRIGGANGWYYGDALWALRGFMDRLVMGVGLRRGRRDPVQVRVGDAIDFWRVEEFEPGRSLRLLAEMKVPGRAWLQFEVEEAEEGAEIHQTAIFDPVGLAGPAYWYLLYPIHGLVFGGMLRRIAARAEAGDAR